VNESNFSPTFYKTGIVFLSDRPAQGKSKDKSMWTGKEYLDLYFTSPVEGNENWLEPELLKGDINGMFDEGPAVFSSDFTRVYFTRTDYKGKNVAKNEQNETILKLYSGRLDGTSWNLESALPFNDEDYSVGHPALSADGNTLFFVSDMPWGYGGTDLYSSTFIDGQWSDPVNLGSRVNTDGDEMFPFYSADSILYFASDGHIGLGGLDIYETNWNGDYWVNPENLQYPVNSPKDDFGYIIDSLGILGYFSSNRVSKTDHIFSFIKHPPIITYDLYVKNSSSRELLNSATGIMINGDDRKKFNSDESGRVSVALPEKANVEIVLQAHGYFSSSISKSTIGVKRSKQFRDTVFLEKIALKKAIVCKNIQFDKKSTKLTPEINTGLDSLYKVLVDNPSIQIEIISHTDSRGSYSSNMRISRKRSDEMSLYLIEKGVSPHRIISKGYGERKLLNYCENGILCLEEDHMINNRVEMKVVDILK
jgi:outer membrane protein OmpA-like peptidoglycan-associated protein